MTTKTGGCGCGGGKKSPSAKCGCGGGKSCGCDSKACQTCTEATYTRPNFFEGQLLTEDDLQSLVQYVVDKNRLHNRYLWGDGVVCGLTVEAEPCNGTKLIVSPGYALDCCGNDLVLQCPATLNVQTMIRELRRRLGADCEDECPPPVAQPTPPVQQPPVGVPVPANSMLAPPAIPNVPKPEEPVVEKPATRRYCLYIRYCETKTDPVAPYDAGDACANAGCQNTRVRESVSFELDCYREPCPPDSIAKRLCECLEEGGSALYQSDNSAVSKLKMRHSEALRNYITGTPAFRTSAMTSATKLAKAFTNGKSEAAWALKREEGVTAVTELLAQHASYFTLDDASRAALTEADKDAVRNSAKTLAAAAAGLQKVTLKDASALETAELNALREQAALWSEFTDEKKPPAEMARLMASRVLPSDTLWAAMAKDADESRTALLRLTESGGGAPFEVTRDLAAIKIPDYQVVSVNPAEPKVATAEMMKSTVKAMDTLDKSQRSLLEECLCKNMHPPCPPCDDPRVLLACFEWEDCKIKSVCMTRKYVWTPNNVSYWFPWLRQFESVMQSLCCPDVCGETRASRAGITNSSQIDPFMLDLIGLYVYGLKSECRKKDETSTKISTLNQPSSYQKYASILGPQANFSFSTAFLSSVGAPTPAMSLATPAAMMIATPTADETVRMVEAALERPEIVELIRKKLAVK